MKTVDATNTLSSAQLLQMGASRLRQHAKVQHIPGVDAIVDEAELRDEIWSYQQNLLIHEMLRSENTRNIADWDRKLLENLTANIEGDYDDLPIVAYTDEALRAQILGRKDIIDAYHKLQSKNPMLLQKLEKSTNPQLLNYIRKSFAEFNLNGVVSGDVHHQLFWTAIEVGAD
ncbi:MAG: hypothetical protein EOP45_11080 [Sphingobacteriaceae bacterium]|nr:MAG: hypothetical protein EOP45_11080 [Sphingobacteriaceae bacterium]